MTEPIPSPRHLPLEEDICYRTPLEPDFGSSSIMVEKDPRAVITPKRGRVVVGLFMTDEKGGVVRRVSTQGLFHLSITPKKGRVAVCSFMTD